MTTGAWEKEQQRGGQNCRMWPENGRPHAAPGPKSWHGKGSEKSCSQKADAALSYPMFPEFISLSESFSLLAKTSTATVPQNKGAASTESLKQPSPQHNGCRVRGTPVRGTPQVTTRRRCRSPHHTGGRPCRGHTRHYQPSWQLREWGLAQLELSELSQVAGALRGQEEFVLGQTRLAEEPGF